MNPELLNLLESEQSETVLKSDNSEDFLDEHIITSDINELSNLFFPLSKRVFLINFKM